MKLLILGWRLRHAALQSFNHCLSDVLRRDAQESRFFTRERFVNLLREGGLVRIGGDARQAFFNFGQGIFRVQEKIAVYSYCVDRAFRLQFYPYHFSARHFFYSLI